MSGLDLARRVSRQRPEIRILFASGCTNIDQHRAEVPLTQLPKKPFRRIDLAQRVHAILNEPKKLAAFG